MWSVSKSPIGCNILPKCLSAVITDTKISSHSGRLTIIVTQFVTNIKAPLGNYEIPISGLRIGGTINIYLKRQSDFFFTIFTFHWKEMWKVSLSTLPLIWWRPKCTRSQVMSLDLTTYLQQSNPLCSQQTTSQFGRKLSNREHKPMCSSLVLQKTTP